MDPLDPKTAAVWRTDRMGKATLYESRFMMMGVNAFAPGQSHPLHAHADADKVYLVIEGSGRFQLGDRTFSLDPGQVLVAPAGVPHAVENATERRLLVLVTMAPPPAPKT